MKCLERRHDQDDSDSLRPFPDPTESNFTVTLLELLTDFGDNVQNLTEELKKKKKKE